MVKSVFFKATARALQVEFFSFWANLIRSRLYLCAFTAHHEESRVPVSKISVYRL